MPHLEPATSYDVIVVGAGAAGLLAASCSAERGRRTLLIEKNRKPGVKILMSGGTRCNITHNCDAAGIIAAFGSAGPFLHSPLAALSPQGLLDLLHEEDLATKVEPGGKIFPKTDRAVDVLNALLRRLRRSGAELALGEPVEHVERANDEFHLRTIRRTLACKKLVITTGGKSYPGSGTTGDGYRWLAKFGHAIRRPRPALVPILTEEAWVRELRGITIEDVQVSVTSTTVVSLKASRKRGRTLPPGVLIQRRGSLLFAHFGLSGPAILDVSRAITGAADLDEVKLRIDFLAAIGTDALELLVRQAAAEDGKRLVAGVLAEQLPRRLVDALLARAEVAIDLRVAEFSTDERHRVIEQLKHCEIKITGTRGFEKAEVTAGGIELAGVDSRTMESKLVPNLYLAGEILDLDGFIGGYNFQAAFSTGSLAGQSV